MKDKSKISIFISIIAVIFSGLSLYFSARKYDDATIFINRPQLEITNSEYKKDKTIGAFSIYKAPWADLSIRVSFGVINNGTRPFAINDINFLYYGKQYYYSPFGSNIFNNDKEEKITYMKDNPEGYCNNNAKFHILEESLANFDTIIVKPGDAQVYIEKNLNTTIGDVGRFNDSFILVCMPVSVVMADGYQEVNSKIWFIIHGKFNITYGGDEINLSVEWPSKGITLIQSPFWQIW